MMGFGGVIATLVAILGHPAAAGETGAGGLSIVEAWARATPSRAKTGAAFFVFQNGGGADRLIGATTRVAKRAELHTLVKDGEVMRMRPIDGVDIPAGGTAMLKPGGDHVMLMGLAGALRNGSSFPMSLIFARAGTVTVEVKVRAIGARSSLGHDDMTKRKKTH